MIKKNYSINLDIELKSRLDAIAKSKFISSSSIINDLIFKYVEEISPSPEKPLKPEKVWTEEERLADWEFRKDQVAQGKQPAWFGEENPVQPHSEIFGNMADDFLEDLKRDKK